MDLQTCAAQASAHPRIHTPQGKDTLPLHVQAAAWLLTQDSQPNRILTGVLSNLPDHLQCFFLLGSTSATPHGRVEQKRKCLGYSAPCLSLSPVLKHCES